MKARVTLEEYLVGERPGVADLNDVFLVLGQINANLVRAEENRRKNIESFVKILGWVVGIAFVFLIL